MNGRRRETGSGRRTSTISRRIVPAAVWAAGIAVPLVFLVLISLKTQQQYAVDPLGLPNPLHIENFQVAWTSGNLGPAFINTLVITVGSVLGVVIFAALASYSISRWTGRLGSRAYIYFALGLIVPFQLGLPTLFKMWAGLGLVNTLGGVILIQIGAGLPFAVFLYSGFLRTVPLELEEAARVDGAGDIRTFVSIVFPLLRPVTATVVILTSIGVWNDLIVSLFFLQTSDRATLPKATIGFFSAFNSNLPVVFACAVLTVIPIVVLFVALQRFFLSGFAAGALRG